jgi:two-component system copper resistance phosphate regulon response regulator CusR
MSIRVLVVEDEEQVADFLVRGLREEGFTVEHAADVESAWRALWNENWDGVLLDWGLPGPDGLALLRRLRQQGSTIPVLLLTARDAVPDRVRGLDAGADDYLSKPFAFEELLARIRALSRRRQSSSTQVISHGVRADMATQQAEREGHSLHLTAKELALLLFFLRNPNEVLMRNRIYEEVWGEQYDGQSNTLEVHIMALRRELEAHGPRLIHTRRGQGYFFGEAAGVARGASQ